MTSKEDDSAPNPDLAKLAGSYFGLDKLPEDLGGEVLFDEYDDAPVDGSEATANDSSASATDSEGSSPVSGDAVPNSGSEDLDDLIK